MFGYIRPQRDELRMRDYDRYHAAYCGLCHALGKRYGFASRFLVSYDMTFLYLLLQSPDGMASTRICYCPARVRRRTCEVDSFAMDLAADFSVLLYCWKLRDEIQDERFTRRFTSHLALGLLHRAYRKAANAHPDVDAQISRQIKKLAQFEAQQSDVLDAPADAFAQILTCFAAVHSQKRVAEQLLYHVGRYIYLVDALDDLASDCEKDRYNPLRYRFQVENGMLSEQDKTYFLSTVHSSIGMACAALELLELRSGKDLLHNIVYEGMPAVLHAVAAGLFENKGKI